jgi:hypothetical protein
MTALSARRHRNFRTAGAIGAVSALLMVLSIVVGVSSLVNSDAGRDVTGGARPDRLRFPVTPTAAVGLLDGRNELLSVAMLVLRPEGVGGNLVVIPAQADVTPGFLADADPDSLANQWSQGGQERFELHVESVSAVSLDIVEMVEVTDVASVFNVADPFPWTLADDLESDTLVALSDSEILGRAVLPGVQRDLTHAEFAALMSWSHSDPDSEFDLSVEDLEAIRVSLWSALVQAMPVGEARESVASEEDSMGASSLMPGDLSEFLDRLSAGEIGVRGLRVSPTSDPAVVSLDRAEVLMVFAQIAPARVAAPNESSRFRVVARLDGQQQAEIGASNADLARDLIAQLLFLDANVVSVQANDAVPQGVVAPAVTVLEVADEAMAELMAEQWSRVFGQIEISLVEVAIEGVDATIIIGMNYETLRSATAAAPNRDGVVTTAPSSED